MGMRTKTSSARAVGRRERWKYLRPRQESGRRQLYVDGGRLPASVVWSQMIVNGDSREETAANWDLPLDAVDEIIRYCEENEDLLNAEAGEQRKCAEQAGIQLEPPPAH